MLGWRYPALSDALPRWRLLWTGGLGVRDRGGDGTLGWGWTWGCFWGSRGGQGWDLGGRGGHVCQVGSAWGRGPAPLQPPLLQSQFLLDFLHFSSELPPFSFEPLSLGLAHCPVSSPWEPGLKCHQEHLFVDYQKFIFQEQKKTHIHTHNSKAYSNLAAKTCSCVYLYWRFLPLM